MCVRMRMCICMCTACACAQRVHVHVHARLVDGERGERERRSGQQARREDVELRRPPLEHVDDARQPEA